MIIALLIVRNGKFKYYGLLMILISISRTAIQIIICQSLTEPPIAVLISLSMIFTIYSKEHKLYLISYLLLVDTYIDERDIYILIGTSLLGILVLYQIKSIKYKQVNQQTRDFDVIALPNKEDLTPDDCSPVYGACSPMKEVSRSFDSQMFDEYAWIKGQQFIVLDEELNVVFQTFSMSSMQKNTSFSSYETDSVANFLQIGIINGNKDFLDVVTSSFLVKQQRFTINDLVQKVIVDYELYKANLFIIRKVDAIWLQDSIIKVFLTYKNRRIFAFIQLEYKDSPTSPSNSNQTQLIQLFTQDITSSINTIMTLSALSETDKNVDTLLLDKYFYPIRLASLQIFIHLASLRDFNMHLQKKLMLRIAAVKSVELFDDVFGLVHDWAMAKGIIIKIDVSDVDQIETDQERIKQMMLPLIKVLVKETRDGSIIIVFAPIGQHQYSCSITSSQVIDERELRSIKLSLQRSHSSYCEIAVSNILAHYLSGSLRKGLQIEVNEHGTSFIFYLQSFITHNEEMRVIKLIGQNQYYETSLSQILGQGQVSESSRPQETNTLFKEGTFKQSFYRDGTIKQSMEHSLHFSQSHISKQQSQKFSESYYVSQLSKKQADSATQKMFGNSNTFKKEDSLNYDEEDRVNSTPIETKYQLPHFRVEQEEPKEQTFFTQPGPDKMSVVQSALDFGSEQNNTINVPISSQPKMQGQIVKFSTQGRCCSRVLIADSEFQNIQILEMVLAQLKISATRSFSAEEALKLVDNKKKCKCGSKGFVLYFINVDLPKRGGLWVSRQIKDRMNGELQKGFIIMCAGLTDYYSKIEYYRNGVDQYISLPYDLQEISQILKILT